MQITLMSLSIFFAAATVDIDDITFDTQLETPGTQLEIAGGQWVHLRTHLRCSQRRDLSAPGRPGQRLFQKLQPKLWSWFTSATLARRSSEK